MAKIDSIFDTATNTYSLKREIGAGGSGVVYLVEDFEGQQFALKVLREANSTKRRRFANELNFCQKTAHDHIVGVLDSGVFADGKQKVPFYVMPLYSGTLRTIMKSGLEPGSALRLFDQILSGVEAAHLRGVYHRDLKPENILFDAATGRVAVTDWGIAHFSEEELFIAVETKEQERLANFVYAAPEQRSRGEKVDGRADIFALGLILNEMFTGTVPLAAGHPTITNVAPQFEYADKIVERMMQHDPAKRYQTIEKLKEELIARGNAFVELQKLDQLRREVIAASSPDDPLGGADAKVTACKYTIGEMRFQLEPIPTAKWFAILHRNLSSPTIYNGFQEYFVELYQDGTIGIKATEHSAPHLVPLVKKAVDDVNKQYRKNLTSEAAEAHRMRVAALEQRKAQAEEIERVNRKLQDLV